MEATIPTSVKRRQVLEAKAEAERLHALAYLPRPVKQADGTSMPLCWSGRVHRAFDMANALQRQGDVARLAIVERALVTLQAEAHAAANKAKLAESAYCELCVLAGEQPTFPDVVECPCAGCAGQRAALERLDAVAAYREAAWALLGTTTERPALLDLMAAANDGKKLWRLLEAAHAAMARYEAACNAEGTAPDWTVWR
jgi:hypothetical protein